MKKQLKIIGSIIIVKNKGKNGYVTYKIIDGLKEYAKQLGKAWKDVNFIQIEQEEVNNLFYSLQRLYLPEEKQEQLRKMVSKGIRFSNQELPTGIRGTRQSLNFSQYYLDEK